MRSSASRPSRQRHWLTVSSRNGANSSDRGCPVTLSDCRANTATPPLPLVHQAFTEKQGSDHDSLRHGEYVCPSGGGAMSSSLPGPERNIRPLPQVIPQRCTMRHIAEINRSDSSAPTSIARDRWLVAALRRRDSTAAEHLVAAYSDRAIRLATGITGNAQDAEEVVQDAFLSVIQKIDTFRGDAAFGSWL